MEQSNKISRTRSALQMRHQRKANLKTFIASIPQSQSQFFKQINTREIASALPTHRVTSEGSLSRIKRNNIDRHALSNVSRGSTVHSSLWRIVHASNSSQMLQHHPPLIPDEVCLNLVEKVQRLRSKRGEQEMQFNQDRDDRQRSIKKKVGTLKLKGEVKHIQRKIKQILQPWEQAMQLREERYRQRLLKIKKY